MDRRVFLRSTGSAAVCAGGLLAPASIITKPALAVDLFATAEFAPMAQQFAGRLASLSAGRFTLHRTDWPAPTGAQHNGVSLGSLHGAVALHPGFAYFAGLPGALGMPAPAADAWRRHDGHALWQSLQQAAGVNCLPAGYTAGGDIMWSRNPAAEAADLTGQRVVCEGLSRDVIRGIGASAVEHDAALGDEAVLGFQTDEQPCWPQRRDGQFRWRTRSVIIRVASPVMVTVPPVVWNRLTTAERDLLGQAALGMPQQAPPHPRPLSRAAAPSQSLAATIDRIAEAVVADIAGHDRLTRQIDAAYFATRRRIAPSGPGFGV